MIYKKLFLPLLLSCTIATTALTAQSVKQLKFVGLSNLSNTAAKEISGLRVGERITPEKINDSIKNFFSQGYFNDVWINQSGGVLTYHFKEKLAIANVDIKGYGSGNDGKELLQGIGIKKGDLYDSRRIKRAKATLVAKLESQGYYDTVVEVTTESIGKSSISIVFDVNKGEKIIIQKMNFVGSSSLMKNDIELDIANKEKDILGWLPWRNNGEASVQQLEYDTYRIKDAYMRRGYLDAYVSKPLMRVDFGSYNAEVDYQVVEGIQYRVGTVTVSQKVKGVKTSNIKSKLSLVSGNIFNIKRMRKDIKLIEEEIGNHGYAYVKVMPQMHKNTKAKTINLQYVVRPNQVVTINDVIISGNSTTKDRVIRRYIYLAPGDKYNATDLKESKSSLGRTGFFEKVEVKTQKISANKVNLLVQVKETSTGTISAGGGYGKYEGVMFNASVSDKNIFGSGINSTIGFEVSKISKNYNLSFSNPKIWDSMYSFGMSFYKKEYEYYNFTEDKMGGSVTVGKELTRHLHGSIGLAYSDNKSEANEDKIVSSEGNITYYDTYGLYNDQYKKVSIFTTLNYNNTDDYYIPREGMKAILSVEYGQLSGSDFNSSVHPDGYGDIIKTNLKLGFYYGLEDTIDYDLVLRAKFRATSINSASEEKLPIAEKLFMGGVGSLRGFDAYSLSPSSNGEVTGGKNRASVSLEASIPLSEAAKMRLAFFYDYGMIGEDSFSEIKRSSVGVMLEWQSAFGPINLVLAQALDDKDGDRTSVFEFSMGTKF